MQNSEQRDILMEAVRYLAGMDPDGAREQNGVGFNGSDSNFGRSLAQASRWTNAQRVNAHKMVQKYRVQVLKGTGLDVASVPTPERIDRDAATEARVAGQCVHCGVRFVPGTLIRFVGRDRYLDGHQPSAQDVETGMRILANLQPERQSEPVIAQAPPVRLPVAPVIAKALPKVQPGESRAIIGAGGRLSETLPGYEVRDAQLEMADVVETGIRTRTHTVVEAGTGTGKSMGYLIPIIATGERAIVSTADKSLQAQIWFKDIPFLQKNVKPFSAAILKGMSNYACILKVGDLREAGDEAAFATPEAAVVWPEFNEWVKETETGDLEDSGSDFRSIHADVTTTSEDCHGKKCAHYDRCFVVRAKGKANAAQIVIVNHALLLRDRDIRHNTGFGLLPASPVIVLDEAHHLEDIATDAFGTEFRMSRWNRLSKQLENLTTEHKHIKSRIMDAAKSEALGWTERASTVDLTAEAFTQSIRERMERSNEQRFRLGNEMAMGEPVIAALSMLAEKMVDETPAWLGMTEKGKDERESWKRLAKQIGSLAESVLLICTPNDNVVRYAEINRDRLTLVGKPIDVSEALQARLWDATVPVENEQGDVVDWLPLTVVATSATIATGDSFSYWKSRVGMGNGLELVVGSPFDYRHNSLLYVPANGRAFDPSDRTNDGSIAYFERLAQEIEALLLASDGRAFCLFTSFKALNETYSRLAPRLRWTLLKQGDAPRQELVARFKADGRAVLFGVKSFWEGVDVQGEALSMVIIDKMPFNSPGDPVWDARCERIGKETGDKWAWFNQLAIPTAIIALKQGFGRLVRTKEDRGTVAVLDGRLRTKGYGTRVINSLPPATQTNSLDVVRAFY